MAKVRDNRKKLDKILKQLDLTDGVHVVVGVPKSTPPREDSDDVTMAEVAFFNEFGTRTIPERSFLRATVDKNREKYFKIHEKLVDSFYLGDLNAVTGFKLLGEQAKADVQATITAGVPPPNADVTVERKKSSKTLVDTGALRQSITYEIRGLGT